MSYRYYYMQRHVFRLGAACGAALLLTAFPAAQNREPAPSGSAAPSADYSR
jgi:hypothetical protein